MQAPGTVSIWKDRDKIRAELESVMPVEKEKARKGAVIVRRYLENPGHVN